MKKEELYNIWKKDYFLDDILISKIILKNENITLNNLFLLSEIENVENILNDFEKYKSWTPIEYILWYAEFFWLTFFVDNRVLIPRNDTEILVSKALETSREKVSENISYIDIWSGSWCIPISLLKNIEFKYAFWVDLSLKALEVFHINLKKHWLENKIKCFNSNLLEVFLNTENYSINELKDWGLIITANLPYIKNEDLDNMDDWVFFFEPSIALFWGKQTWFELYEKLISQIFDLKKIYNIKEIILFIEIGFDQYEYSKEFLENLWLKHEYFKDMSWIFRLIKIYF